MTTQSVCVRTSPERFSRFAQAGARLSKPGHLLVIGLETREVLEAYGPSEWATAAILDESGREVVWFRNTKRES